LENIDIISPRAVGVLLADKVYETKIIGCKVSCAGLVGIMLIRDVNETLIKNCTAEYCQQGGVFLTDLKLPENIDPLDFEAQLHHTDKVIGNFGPFSAQDPSPYRTDIIACVFQHNRKMGITTDGVAYLSVKNTVISKNDCEGITIDNGSWGCIIQNCHIYNNGWRGLQHEQELGIDFVSEMGLMDDGSSKAKLPGISLDNAAYTQIENNHIECNWGDGIKLVRAAYASAVVNNLIENNNRGVNDRFHYFGVLVGVAERQHAEQHDFASCYNRITGNTILGQHFSAIHL
jgi:parallel beta-helix repeat protein